MYEIRNNKLIYNDPLQTAVSTFKHYFTEEIKDIYCAFEEIEKNAPSFLGKILEGMKNRLLIVLVANAAGNGVDAGLQASGTPGAQKAGKAVEYGIKAVAFIYLCYLNKKEGKLIKKAKKFLGRIREQGGLDTVIKLTVDYLISRFLLAFEELAYSPSREKDLKILAVFFAASLGDIIINNKITHTQDFIQYIYENIVPPKGHTLYKKDLPFFDIKLNFNEVLGYKSKANEDPWTVQGLLLRSACYGKKGEYSTQSKNEDHSQKYPPQYLSLNIAQKFNYSIMYPLLEQNATATVALNLQELNQLNLEEELKAINEIIQKNLSDPQSDVWLDLNTSYPQSAVQCRISRFNLIEELNLRGKNSGRLLKNYSHDLCTYLYLRSCIRPDIVPTIEELVFIKKQLIWLKSNLNSCLKHINLSSEELKLQNEPNNSRLNSVSNFFFNKLAPGISYKENASSKFKSEWLATIQYLIFLERIWRFAGAKAYKYGIPEQIEIQPNKETNIATSILQFKEEMMAHLNNCNALIPYMPNSAHIVDMHWYSDNEIIQLIKLYAAQSQSNIELFEAMLATTWLAKNESWQNALRSNLINYTYKRQQEVRKNDPNNNTLLPNIEQAFSEKEISYRLLIPINLAAFHWALLFIQYPQAGHQPIQVYFFSPTNSQIGEELKEMFKDPQVLGPNVVVHNFGPVLQENYKDYNCGPWVIECAFAFMQSNMNWSPKKLDINKIREKHQALLQNWNISNLGQHDTSPYEYLRHELRYFLHQLEELNGKKIIDGLQDNSKEVNSTLNKTIAFIQNLKSFAKNIYFAAIATGDLTLIKELEALKKYDCNWKMHSQSGHSALHYAAFYGYKSAFNYLYEQAKSQMGLNDLANSFCSEDGSTLLHSAVFGCHSSIIGQLINDGFDVNAVNRNKNEQKIWGKRTPLHIAMMVSNSNKYIVIEQLLNKGAAKSLVIQDAEGCTPLHLLLKKTPINSDLLELFTLLIHHYPEEVIPCINMQNNYGWTLLHIALNRVDLSAINKLVSLLIITGADVRLLDKNSKSPLNILLFKLKDLDLNQNTSTPQKDKLSTFFNPPISGDDGLIKSLKLTQELIESEVKRLQKLQQKSSSSAISSAGISKFK